MIDIQNNDDQAPVLTPATSHFTTNSTSAMGTKSKSKKSGGSSRIKELRSGKRPFQRLGSTIGPPNDGWPTPTPGGSGNGAQPFEVRVTTTIEVISTILSNDGKRGSMREPAIPSTLQEDRIGEREPSGFRHGYGPKGMHGWL